MPDSAKYHMYQPTITNEAMSSWHSATHLPPEPDCNTSPQSDEYTTCCNNSSNTSGIVCSSDFHEGSTKIVDDLRNMLDEQHSQLIKRVEETMSEAQKQLLQQLKLETSPKQAIDHLQEGRSRNASDEIGNLLRGMPGDMKRQETPDSNESCGSRQAKVIHQTVPRFDRQEVEDKDLYEKARRVSHRAKFSSHSKLSRATSDASQHAWRRLLIAMLSSIYYEVFIAAMITVNAIYIGWELQFMVDHGLQQAPTPLAITNYTFACVFTLELVLRIVAEGPAFAYAPSRRAWNCVDSLLVLFSLIESGVDIYQSSNGIGVDGVEHGVEQLGSVRAIRVLRITRLLRIFRIARIVRFVRSLRTLVYSIMCTLKSLAWAMVLLLLIVYVFALVFTQAATDHLTEAGFQWADAFCSSSDPLGDDYLCILDMYWGSLSSSISTLYKSIAGGISWDIIVQPLHRISPIWAFVFLGYFTFTYLAVLNVVTGVFCQSAIEGAQHDHDLLVHNQIANKEFHVKRIKELFHAIDSDRSGMITFDELSEHIEDAEVLAFFESMELTTADAWTLFRLLDNDHLGQIEAEEFIDGVLRLRGVAKSIDMTKLMHDMKWLGKHVINLATYIHFEMSRLHEVEARRKDTTTCFSNTR